LKRKKHYVVLRDDDTNASTPAECLDRLYRPFLERGLPVNLAVIPAVRLDAVAPSGAREEFLWNAASGAEETATIASNRTLVRYLQHHPGYGIVQQGYDHSLFEFDSARRQELHHRFEAGTQLLLEAGFRAPQTFVAPYDRFSSAALAEAAKRFRVVSTGWFELRRLPIWWWPRYLLKKLGQQPHWRIGQTLLLSHPGCLLSRYRPYDTIFAQLKRTIESRTLTVLVTHWWEYFRDQQPDDALIDVLHQTADYLGNDPNISVVSFEQIASGTAFAHSNERETVHVTLSPQRGEGPG